MSYLPNEFANHEGLWVHNGFALEDAAAMEWAFASGTLGEAATATVLAPHEDKAWAFNFLSDTRHADLFMCPVDDFGESEAKMNGASVAGQGGRRFATFARKIHPQFCKGLKAIAAEHPFDLADADVVFPHSHAQWIWVDLAKELEMKPHWHPRNERVTVLEGRVGVGFGDAIDREKLTWFGAGDYYVNAKHAHHYVLTDGPAVLQVTGIGPWKANFVQTAAGR